MNIFMQMIKLSLGLRKLLWFLSAGEIEEGHFLPKAKKRNCRYRVLNVFGGMLVCVFCLLGLRFLLHGRFTVSNWYFKQCFVMGLE